MSSDINSKIEQIWHRFQDKKRRDAWASSHLGTSLAAQIFNLREARGWTQKRLADEVGMAQSRISLMEDPDYEKFNVSTLKRLASAFDVVFVGRFAPFSEMLDWSTKLTPDKLAPRPFTEDRMPGSAQDVPQARQSTAADDAPHRPRPRGNSILRASSPASGREASAFDDPGYAVFDTLPPRGAAETVMYQG